MPKSFAQQIEDDENKIKRIREHQRMVRAKQAKQERNARTKRLVETGAIVEKAHGGAYDDEGRQTFSDGLNGIISVYDPSRGGNASLSRRVNANSQPQTGKDAGDHKLIKKGEC